MTETAASIFGVILVAAFALFVISRTRSGQASKPEGSEFYEEYEKLPPQDRELLPEDEVILIEEEPTQKSK